MVSRRLLPTATALLALAPLHAFAQAPVSIGVELVATGFLGPVLVTSPAGDPRLFVLDQSGQIWIVQDGERINTPFLDIGGDIAFGGEQGLLGLAFHPDYASNGRFFINFTDHGGESHVVGYTVSADPNIADPASATELLLVDQPAGNHNGGWLGFGPDGYLYAAFGDGGGGGDTYGNGQNPDTLLAKILRIDVNGAAPYTIPQDNPFANGGAVAEAYISGVRNPWRVSFDGNLLYIADVGQGAWEEVTVVDVTTQPGANLGWPVLEGNHCYDARSCDDAGFTPATYEYSHDEGCSITGGYVYRGSAIPALVGHYFFADYCTGFVRSFLYEGGAATNVVDWSDQIGNLGNITSFGEDAAGELYITSADGAVYRIVPR